MLPVEVIAVRSLNQWINLKCPIQSYYRALILNFNRTLVSRAYTLIFNMKNNYAENFKRQLCKMSGKKRLDFSRAGGINRRAHISLLAYQTPAQGWKEQAHTAITGRIPKTPVRAFVPSRNRRHLKRKLFPNKRMKKTNETVWEATKIVEFSKKPDVPGEIYLELKDNFFK